MLHAATSTIAWTHNLQEPIKFIVNNVKRTSLVQRSSRPSDWANRLLIPSTIHPRSSQAPKLLRAKGLKRYASARQRLSLWPTLEDPFRKVTVVYHGISLQLGLPQMVIFNYLLQHDKPMDWNLFSDKPLFIKVWNQVEAMQIWRWHTWMHRQLIVCIITFLPMVFFDFYECPTVLDLAGVHWFPLELLDPCLDGTNG